jgi:diguanylate cyclase (GGDEF)-like protein
MMVHAAAAESHRAQAVVAPELVDSPLCRAFDRLTRLAARLIGAPAAFVSLVGDHGFLEGAFGGAKPPVSPHETAVTRRLGRRLVESGEQLLVSDARNEPGLVRDLAASELGVVAYAGMPLVVQGALIGAFCVVDQKPRFWTNDQLEALRDFSESVVSEIELRLALLATERRRAVTDAVIESVGDAVLAMDENRIFLVANEAARRVFARAEVGKPLPDDWARLHRSVRLDGTPLPSSEGALVRALRGERTDGLTFTLQAPDATEATWVEASGRPVVDATGRVVAGVAVYRDVSDKLRAVDVYATLLRSIPRAAIALFDRELRCVAIDGGLARAGAVPVSEMHGRSMRELAGLEPDDPRFDPIETLYRRTLEGGEGGADYHEPHTGRVLELHTAPVRDAMGRIQGGIVLALDRTLERRHETDLRRSEQINRALVQYLPNGAVFMVDRDLRFVAAEGPILPDVLRRGKLTTIIGRTVGEIVSAENRDEILEVYRGAFAGRSERREILRNGRFMEVNAVPIFDEAGAASHAIVFLYDVTERKAEAEELRRTRDLLAHERTLLKATLGHIADGVVLLNGEHGFLLANSAYSEMFALPLERLEGLTREPFLAHLATLLEDPVTALATFEQHTGGPQDYVLARPRKRVLRRTETPIELAHGSAFLVTWQDVTAEKELLAERERQLTVDALTGIANRRGAELALAVEDQRRQRMGTPLTVAIIDVDHFKQVNDRYGHPTGDEVLRRVAMVLATQARVTDLVARWGGEEFIAILPGAVAGARAFAERARSAIEEGGASWAGAERVTVSVGVAEVGATERVEDAIARADACLYEAKRSGRNRVVA